MRRHRWHLPAAVAGLLVPLLLAGRPAAAQSGRVTGTVTEKLNNTPIAGARVQLGNTNRVVTANRDGHYTITGLAAGNYVLHASAIGFSAATASVTVADTTSTVDFALSRSAISLEDIVVTPTGNERARESGTSIATIKTDTTTATQTLNDFGDLLSGRTAGVTVMQSGGSVGTGTRVRIRGLSSISLSNEPVYYVDGIKVESGASSLSVGTGGQSPSRIDDLDPNDIESVEIVKGPAASTLYGTQAANGVVRITTRHGISGKTQWRAFSEVGVLNDMNQYPVNYFSWGHFIDSLPKMVIRQCTLVASTTLRASKGNTPVCAIDSLTSFNVLENPSTTPIGAGYRGQAGLQVSGGSDQLQYYLSSDYSDNIGVLRLSDAEYSRLTNAYAVAPPYNVYRPNQLKQVNLRSNIHAQATRTLDITGNLGVLQSTTFLPQNDNNVTGLLPSGLFGKGQAGSPSEYGFFLPGDVSQITTQQNINRLTGSLTGNWLPTPWFTGRATAGLDYTGQLDLQTQLRGQGPAFSNFRQGRITDNRFSIYHYTADIGGTGSFSLTPDLTSKTSLGFQYLHDYSFEVAANGQNLPPGGQAITTAATRTSSQTTVAAVTMGTYVEQEFGYLNRLFVTGGLRNDRNSAFGSETRSVLYPKISVSWVTSDEPFFPRTSWLTNLRLRAAYGAAGQQPGTTAALQFLTAQTAAVAGLPGQTGTDQPAVLLTAFGNPNLKPERSADLDIGFDASVIQDVAKLEFTYYDKETSDALINVPLPPSQGVATARFVNLGSTQNKGLEIGINAAKDITSSISVDGNLSISRNINTLKSLGKGIPTIVNGNEQRDTVGFPILGFWDHAITGFKDLNGDGIIEPNEVTVTPTAVYLGSSIPKTEITMNAGVNFLHNRLRLGGQLDYRGDYKVYNLTERFRCAGAGFNCAGINNPKDNLFDQARAVVATSLATSPLFGSQAGYIEDGTFLKLRELSLTYYAPDRWAQYIGAAHMQFSLTGRNLLKWTNYTGLDPEVDGNGQSDLADDFLTAPPVRTVAFRVSVDF